MTQFAFDEKTSEVGKNVSRLCICYPNAGQIPVGHT